VLIPSPNVAEDHQTKNADALASNDAAILITDQDAPEKLIDTVLEILKDKDKMQRLGNNIKKLALTGATEKIADEIQKLLH
jgi:UDP-N-acetylglucosamine--N-acetylmuramyl-(pentapeptide) pyrophosphoryl-undecaprenol N-acetylglucosamine transferase